VDRAVKADRSRRLREQADALALAHRARLVGREDEVVVETRSVAGYGAGAGVLMTDAHVATATDGAQSGEPVRTGYTRDYSPLVLPELPDDVPDGTLLAVRLDALDPVSGVLVARAVEPSTRRSRTAKHAPAAAASS
jgi:hypothetical protein